jgi:peptide/nickel transport system substrate-binding protein
MGGPSDRTAAGLWDVVSVPAVEDLVHHDNQFRIVPVLGTSCDVSADGKTIIFGLPKGVLFQDGTPLNADALKYNIENYAPLGVKPTFIKSITSYEIVNDYTLKLNLAKFDLDLLMAFVSGPGAVASPKALQVTTTPANMAKDHMVGSGAFKVANYQANVELSFTKVNNYWRTGKPYLDGIKFLEVADPMTARQSFESGQGQFLYRISPRFASELEAKGYQIVREQLNPIGYITPDGANPDSPFANVKVRQAAEYAIDKKAIAKVLGLGYYPVANQFALPEDPQFNPGLSREYDPIKAKQLLTEAGYPNGFKTTLYADASANKDELGALQGYLKDVGIDAQQQVMDLAAFSDMVHKGWKNGIILNRFPVNAGLPTKITMFFSADLTQNQNVMASVYRPAEWSNVLNAAVAEPDIAKRTVLDKSLIKMMFDNAMAIPIWSAPELSAQDKKVHDLGWGVGHGHFWSPETAWLSK